VIRWVRLAAACGNALFLVLLLSAAGLAWVGVIAAVGNFLWAASEKLSSRICRSLSPGMLVINTVACAWGVLNGGPAAYAVVVAGGSLLSWNSALFLDRWQDPPAPVQRRYLRRVGGTVALGLGAGLSAIALQGSLSVHISATVLLMLGAGVLLLRLFSRAARGLQ
jgi:hypothetical protein